MVIGDYQGYACRQDGKICIIPRITFGKGPGKGRTGLTGVLSGSTCRWAKFY
jgi:hypothetical protein